MNIYTVSFFGHRYIERGTEIECCIRRRARAICTDFQSHSAAL